MSSRNAMTSQYVKNCWKKIKTPSLPNLTDELLAYRHCLHFVVGDGIRRCHDAKLWKVLFITVYNIIIKTCLFNIVFAQISY